MSGSCALLACRSSACVTDSSPCGKAEESPQCCSEGGKADHALYDTTKFCGELGRLAALHGLEMLDTPREDYFDKITALMQRIFTSAVSHLVLVDPGRCWFKSWQGKEWNDLASADGLQSTREDGWCNYITVATKAEVLVIEDSQKDARVSLNPFVIGPPYFRFYAGAPLVGSQGERYGTLCVADFKPRAFSAEKYALLVNFAALAVEELERNKSVDGGGGAGGDVQLSRHLDMSLQAVRQGIVMFDMRESDWPIIYANAAFASTTGIPEEELTSSNFWSHFQCDKTRIELGLATGMGDSVEAQFTCSSAKGPITLRLVPASSDQVAPSKATGIPVWAPTGDAPKPGSPLYTSEGGQTNDIVDSTKCFWFAIVRDGSGDSPSTTAGSTASSLSSCGSYSDYPIPQELGMVQLGPLLGTGSFGKVYHATLNSSQEVAIKVIDCRRRLEVAIDSQLREVQLSAKLQHPNIVKVIAYATSRDVSSEQEMAALWLVQELCNLGTLTLAAERGWLRQERRLDSPADMRVLVPTLSDIANAMAFVHGKGVIHADLTGRNVLLSSSSERPCGFGAKICDFGLARYACGQPFATEVMGTVTHMPPEILSKYLLLPEADVWAFGIISWEAFHGKCCYHKKLAAQIVVAVVRNKPLQWDTSDPSDFIALIKQCLAYEPAQRPTFSAIEGSLRLLDL